MNKKYFTSLVLVILVLLVLSGTALAADVSVTKDVSTAPPTEHPHGNFTYEESTFFVTFDGRHYAMNPTELPLFNDERADFPNAMNPTMLPEESLVK